MEAHRVVVWGTGNVGGAAIRAVLARPDLELSAVVVSNPDKVGRDAGTLVGIEPVGVAASDDATEVLATGPAAVVYAASADFRPEDALVDIETCLRSGANLVTPSIYPLYHPPSMPAALRARIEGACQAGESSIFASGIDPGWAMDLLPLVLSGVGGATEQLRAQEIFNYASYHAPDAVRTLVGMGTAMDQTPPMLLPNIPTSVWGPMLRVLADGLSVTLDEIVEHVERRPLERDIDVPGMGRFDAGSQGAFRFEVRGMVDGEPRLVIEHVTRIDDACAPDWPQSPPGTDGCHRVVLRGRPEISVTINATDGGTNSADGGNATAAGRIVNALPHVIAAAPGLIHPLDLPLVTGSLAR